MRETVKRYPYEIVNPGHGKILVIRGGAIGDFILTLPVLAALRQQFPTAQIEVLGYPHIVSLAVTGGLAHCARSIEAQALAYIAKIDELGGAAEAISRGYQQKEIQDSAFAYQKSIETNDLIIVGVNQFTVKEDPPTGLLKIKPEVEIAQKKSLAAVKASRDNAAVTAKLAALKIAATGTDNLLPFILDAVKVYASLGEISDVLRHVFGEHQETVVL